MYCKDASGKPGLFLSWRVSSTDVKNLKTAIGKKNVEKIKKFEGNKIKWLAQIKDGKVLSNLKILKDFPASKENEELQRILNSYAKNVDEIYKEIKEKINSAIEKSPELLVTIKIIKDGTEYYPGDIEDLTKLYKDYRISVG